MVRRTGSGSKRVAHVVVLGLLLCCSRHAASDGPSVEPPSVPAPVPERVGFSAAGRSLGGLLYRPAGRGPFPAVVFNHGSERFPGIKAGHAAFFVPRGFVLFVPHRRGQGLSRDAGEYVEDVRRDAGDDSERYVDALEAQVEDVAGAVDYLAHLPEVDARRIAVVGCSYGGIEALFAAEHVHGIRAVVDFAGAAMMWSRSAALRNRMMEAAREAQVPVLFIQAQNDYDLEPSRRLALEIERRGGKSRVEIFPSHGLTPSQGHAFCRGGPSPPWAGVVLSFLRESFGETVGDAGDAGP